MISRYLLIFVLAISSFSNLYSTHIIGGDFTVQHVADSTFEVTLTLFRDCGSGGAPLDFAIQVSVYEEGTNLPRTDLDFDMNLTQSEIVPLGDDCFSPDICLEIGTYITTITLPDFDTGYYFAWERCCRNPTISNIIAPEDAGMVFLVTIADPAIDNSTPVFQPYPVDGYLCVNGTNSIDFSASDADGDSLVYRLETPLKGELSGDGDIDPNTGLPNPPPNPGLGGPKPHPECLWLPPYELANICGGAMPMSIDSETGILSAFPDVQGSFVFAIAVDEYRDGELLSTIRREIQLESTICALPVPPQFVGFDPIDTIQVYPIIENTVNILVEATGSNVSASVVGEIITPGYEPLATIDTLSVGEGSVTLQLQWDSLPCSFIGDVFLLEFYAEAFSECLDTVLTNTMDLYVEIITDPDVPTTYLTPTVNSYDIIYGQNDTYEFPVTVTDGNPTDTLILSMITDINGTNPIEFQGDTANSLVNSDFSWIVTCDDIRDEPYQVTFQTVTSYCEIQDTTLFFMDLNVMFPTDDSTEFVSPGNDSIYWTINGGENCFEIEAQDDNNIDTLFLSVDRTAPIFSHSNAPTFEESSSRFFVSSEFCWTPECVDIEPGTYPVDFQVVTKNCEIIQITDRTIDIILGPETDGSLDTIPNVFTPNGDLFNEQFEIKYTPDYCVTDYKLAIYNRWGDLIFESQDRDEHWDGTNNGNNVSEGVYYLHVNYLYFDQPKKESGTIHLLRN